MNKEEIEKRLKGVCQDCMWLEKIEPIFNQLQQENKQLKEQVDRLIKKEYEKDNNYIVKVRTGEQLEREKYLLSFKSKSTLASMLIDTEEKIDKATDKLYCWGEALQPEFQKEMLDILNKEK